MATDHGRPNHHPVRGWWSFLAALSALAAVVVLFKVFPGERTQRKPYTVEMDTKNTYIAQKVHLSIHDVGSCGIGRSNAENIKGQATLELVGLDPLQVIVEPCFLEGDISRQIVELPDGRVLYLRSLGRFAMTR